jgi:hypothetical protein
LLLKPKGLKRSRNLLRGCENRQARPPARSRFLGSREVQWIAHRYTDLTGDCMRIGCAINPATRLYVCRYKVAAIRVLGHEAHSTQRLHWRALFVAIVWCQECARADGRNACDDAQRRIDTNFHEQCKPTTSCLRPAARAFRFSARWDRCRGGIRLSATRCKGMLVGAQVWKVPAEADARTYWNDTYFGACNARARPSLRGRRSVVESSAEAVRPDPIVAWFWFSGKAQTCPATSQTVVVGKRYDPYTFALNFTYPFRYGCISSTCATPQPSPWYTDLTKSLWINGQCRYKPCVNPCEEAYDKCNTEANLSPNSKVDDCKCLAGECCTSPSLRSEAVLSGGDSRPEHHLSPARLDCRCFERLLSA